MTTIATKPVPATTLAEMAGRINDLHRRAESSARSTLGCAVEAGKLLTEAKAVCGHGAFTRWVADNCEFSQRAAQTYMRIANHPNAQHAAHLSLSDALKALSSTRQEAAATASVEERLQVLECFIDDAMNKYVDEFPKRADALKTIRDKKLYREEAASFTDYCQKRWKWETETVERVLELGGRLNTELARRPDHRSEILDCHRDEIRSLFGIF